MEIMDYINRIELQGIVGNSRLMTVGTNEVVRFNLATSYFYEAGNGHVHEETVWHSVTAWSGEGMSDLAGITKGAWVYVAGRLRQNRYVAADGEERVFYEVLASEVRILNNK